LEFSKIERKDIMKMEKRFIGIKELILSGVCINNCVNVNNPLRK
jgi:hypothetical protein